MPGKRYLGMTVLEAARQRIAWVFDTFPRIYVSFSGGKDSTVMAHLVLEEAQKRGRKVGLLYIDLEGQYKLTIDHIREMYRLYAEHIEPYWVALPLVGMSNAVSMYEPEWTPWEPGRETDWIRQQDPLSIIDPAQLPFYQHMEMDFESFLPAFGHWYSQGQLCACFVGIRSNESLNRWRTIAGHGSKWKEGQSCRKYTQWIGETLWNIYPIYDWAVTDIWTYHGKTGLPYNQVYDLMYKAGLTLHQMRICQPYGNDQRKGLWLYHLLEPETWARVVARVNGANSGALYAKESGSILGNIKISKPPNHTWKSFAHLLLDSLPPSTGEHYRNKITMFLRYWGTRGYPGDIPDEMPYQTEAHKDAPSWRRICKALLRNDYWCKGLSFSPTKTEAYQKYLEIMQRRRALWNLI